MTVKFQKTNCTLEFGKYSNGRIAIELVETETGEPYATASVNLPAYNIGKDEIAIKDHSENEEMVQALMEAGIVSKPVGYVDSGYVRIPICKLLKTE